MKKTILLLGLLFLSFVPVFAETDSFEVASIENGNSILEFEGGNVFFAIVPQLVKEYDCEGETKNQFVQYNLVVVQKVSGSYFSHVISKQALCELKAVANITKASMARGGKEGLFFDNSPLTLSVIYTPKSFLVKEGWKMKCDFGTNSFFEFAAKDFIKELSEIDIDTAYFDSQNENLEPISVQTIPDNIKELAKKDANLYYAAWLAKSGQVNPNNYGEMISLFTVKDLQSLMGQYSVEELEQMGHGHDEYFERFKKD